MGVSAYALYENARRGGGGGYGRGLFEMKELFFDSGPVMDALDREQRKILSRFGSYVRTRARSSLRRARQKRLAEMSEGERESYERRAAIAQDRGRAKPRRPEIISEPGDPPVLHITPLSANPLRKIFFGYDPQSFSVVIGPLLYGAGGAHRLEYGDSQYDARPFMRPALEAELPELPEMWRDSVRVW